MSQSSGKRLQRSSRDKRIAGVCGGLGEYFGLDPLIFRVLFVVLLFIPGPSVLIYLALWLVLPVSPTY